jgi:hypothetical protein
MAFMAVSMTVAVVGLGRLDQRINQFQFHFSLGQTF